MSVIDWSNKPYPWNEIGPEWVAKLQKLAEKPVEARTVREPEGAATLLRESIYVPQGRSITKTYTQGSREWTSWNVVDGSVLRGRY